MYVGLKGADALAFEAIRKYAKEGICRMSYEELGHKTGYCARTMIRSVHNLHQLRIIDVGKTYGDRRNQYRILVNN
jgi:CRP-like cAMP-binding protein